MKPDLTFFIDANPETIQSRSDYGQERYERIEFQKRVSDAYGKFKDLSRDDDHWVTVPAEGKSIEDLHQSILERVVKYIYDGELDRVDLTHIADSLFM